MESPKRGLFLFIGVLAISAIAGGLYGRPVRATGASAGDIQDSYRSFTKVLAIVERNYADPVDTDKAIYDGAIPGMLHVLDPHSNFFDPQAIRAVPRRAGRQILRRRHGRCAARESDRSCSRPLSVRPPTKPASAPAT